MSVKASKSSTIREMHTKGYLERTTNGSVCTACKRKEWSKRVLKSSGYQNVMHHYYSEHFDKFILLSKETHPQYSYLLEMLAADIQAQERTFSMSSSSSSSTPTSLSRTASTTAFCNPNSVVSAMYVDKDEYIRRLILFCVSTQQSHRLVNRASFQKLLVGCGFDTLVSNYEYVGSLERMASDIQDNMMMMLQRDNPYLTLAFDLWTNCNQERIINVVLVSKCARYLYKSINNQHNSATTTILLSHFDGIIQDLLVQQKLNLCGIVCDNARNVALVGNTASRKYGIIHIGCAAHQIQLVCKSIIEHPCMKELTAKVNGIVRSFRNNQQLLAMLSRQTNKKMIQATTVRWNSQLFVFQRFIDLREVLTTIAVSRPDVSILSQEWTQIIDVVKVLKYFQQATSCVQSESATLYSTARIFRRIEEKLQLLNSIKLTYFSSPEFQQLDWQVDVGTVLRKWTEEQCTSFAIRATNYFTVSCNPRIRDSRDVRSYIKEYGVAILKRNGVGDVSDQISLLNLLGQQMREFEGRSGVFRTHDVDNQLFTRAQANQQFDTLRDAIDFEDKLHTADHEYWNNRMLLDGSKELAVVAMCFLNVVATEASVERTFSTQSNFHTDQRNKLSHKFVESEMFIYYNHPELCMERQREEENVYLIDECDLHDTSI